MQQKIDKERDIDKTPESLILVEGVEAQALSNFLVNCKSCTATTGPLAGIPPTLLAPVAFHGATLRPNKVCSWFIGSFVYTVPILQFILKMCIYLILFNHKQLVTVKLSH